MGSPFPIQKGNKSYYVERENGKISRILVIFHGQDVTMAPTYSDENDAQNNPSVVLKGDFYLLAERDVRAWQSILAPYQVIEIDFDSKNITYTPETPEEEGKIFIRNFMIDSAGRKGLLRNDFSIFGRAFLALEDNYAEIAKMAFLIEAMHHMRADQCIDAYNLFYLFLEANFSLPFKTKAATNVLLKNIRFQHVIQQIACEPTWLSKKPKLTLEGTICTGIDLKKLTTHIVNLRGHLRHNTLSNPNRWDPHKQNQYRTDATFLSCVCQELASPVFSHTFNEKYEHEFFNLAKEENHMTTIRLTITIKDMGTLFRATLRWKSMSKLDDTPNLALDTLRKALKLIDHNAPGGEIYAIRATLQPKGSELFRYDLGPSIARS